jgi:hypothetical protein
MNAEKGISEHKQILKSESELRSVMASLAQPQPPGTPAIPKHLLPKGGKAFEEAEFSTGLLILPPLSSKQIELANHIESFYIASAAENSVSVTIHNSTNKLSKGDTFIVPFGNTYTIKNLSSLKQAKLHFTLVKPHHIVLQEVFQQQQQQQQLQQAENKQNNNNNNPELNQHNSNSDANHNIQQTPNQHNKKQPQHNNKNNNNENNIANHIVNDESSIDEANDYPSPHSTQSPIPIMRPLRSARK